MHPVWSIIAVVVLSMSHIVESPGLKQSPPSLDLEPGRIEIAFDETIEMHPWHEDITTVCRADYEVKGCTDFPIEKLDCDCEKRDGFWVINASASIKAVIHMPNGFETAHSLAHEQDHIADLESALRLHLETLVSRRYENVSSCRKFARFLNNSTHLRVVMNQLRVESNEKFGCSRGQANDPAIASGGKTHSVATGH